MFLIVMRPKASITVMRLTERTSGKKGRIRRAGHAAHRHIVSGLKSAEALVIAPPLAA